MDQENNGAPRITDKRGANHKPANAQPLQPPQFGELDAEALEKLREQAAADDSTPHDPDRRPMLTAFLVIIDHDGSAQATTAFEILEQLELSRPATFADMYSAAAHIQKDIQNQEAALHTAARLKAEAQQAQDQLLAARVRQQQMQGQGVPRK